MNRVRSVIAAGRDAFRDWWLLALLAGLLVHLVFLASLSNRNLIPSPVSGKPLLREMAWDSHTIPRAWDFGIIWVAGRQARRGNDVYTIETQPGAPREVGGYRYLPPTAYLVGLPLSLLSPRRAYAVWLTLNELMLVLIVAGCVGLARSRAAVRCVVLFALCYFPLFVEYHMGQFSFFMGFLIFASVLAMEHGHVQRSCWWWLASVYAKHYSAVMIVAWARLEKLRFAELGIGSAVLLSALYFVVFPEWLGRFLDLNFAGKVGGVGAGVPRLHWGAMGVQFAILAVERLAGIAELRLLSGVTAYQLSVALVVLAVLAGNCWTCWRTSDKALCLAVWWPAWFFFYANCWEHHYVMLLPLLMWAAARDLAPVLELVLVYILLASPSLWSFISGYPVEGPRAFLATAYYCVKPVGVVLLQALLWCRALRETQRH